MESKEQREPHNQYGTYGDLTIDVNTVDSGYRLELTRNGESRPMILRDAGDDWPAVVPVVPDRPVAIVPDTPVAVLTGGVYRMSVMIPSWLRITCSDRGAGDHRIDEVPSVLLKKSWSGSAENGEPVYHLRYQNVEASPIRGRHEFEVPIEIRNSSASILWIEQLVVRVVHLDLFILDDTLRSNEVVYDFRGREQESRISFQRSSLVERLGGRRVSSARIGVSSDIIKKSFYWIRDLAV